MFATDTIVLTNFSSPDVHISYSLKDFCRSDTINLSGTGALSYQWYLNDYFAFPKEVGNVFNYTINSQTKITLVGTDENNCSTKDEITLMYIPCCGNASFPNAFTPNGDGLNDYFHVITNAVFEVFSLKIYDRWGNLVFETKNSKDKWDGTYKGHASESGNYFFLVKTKCYEEKNTVMNKGDILLIR